MRVAKPAASSGSGAPAMPARARCVDEDGWPRVCHPTLAGARGVSHLRLSTNASGIEDIRASCGVCGATRSRTCKPADANGRGRPIGALWCWIHFPCGGDSKTHSAEPWDILETRFEFRQDFVADFLSTKWLMTCWRQSASQMMQRIAMGNPGSFHRHSAPLGHQACEEKESYAKDVLVAVAHMKLNNIGSYCTLLVVRQIRPPEFRTCL